MGLITLILIGTVPTAYATQLRAAGEPASACGEGTAMAETRKLAAILAADVAGASTSLAEHAAITA